jgi:hypothetical protein
MKISSSSGSTSALTGAAGAAAATGGAGGGAAGASTGGSARGKLPVPSPSARRRRDVSPDSVAPPADRRSAGASIVGARLSVRSGSRPSVAPDGSINTVFA